MKKYILFFKNAISESLVYRTNVFLIFISQFASTVALIIFWSAIYSEGGKIGNYELQDLVQYFIFVGLIGFAIQGVDISWRVSEEIRVGSVTNYILKPMSYYRSILSIAFGKSIVNMIIIILVIIPILFFGGYLGGLTWGPEKIIIIFISLAISFLLFATYSFIVGLYTFWSGDSRGFNYVGKLIMLFFSGSIIPLNLLPDYIMRINQWLPFKNIAWIPVSLLTGKIEAQWMALFPGIIWTLILFLLTHITFNQALKKYEGLGA
ncbi:MAG TPA: ABC-2 family transporter protein [Patescibacteria group bacterium]|nr:ABC-2 family transporter protein [Patescibacteria group bacterium]